MAKRKAEQWYMELSHAMQSRHLASDVGTNGVLVLHVVMIQQFDTGFHESLVPISNIEIMSKAALLNEDSFRSIRKRLVASGWLTYVSKGTRKPGMYAVHLPGQHFCESSFSFEEIVGEKKRPPLSAKKRFAVLKKSNFCCTYCGRKPPEVKLQVDHIVAFSKGGDESDDNLVAACSDCNYGKGSTDAYRNA